MADNDQNQNISISDLIRKYAPGVMTQPPVAVPPVAAPSQAKPLVPAPVQATATPQTAAETEQATRRNFQTPKPPQIAGDNFEPPDPNLRGQGNVKPNTMDIEKGPSAEDEKKPSFQEKDLAPTERTAPIPEGTQGQSISDILKPIAPPPNKGLFGIPGWWWASLAPGKLGQMFGAMAEHEEMNQPAFEIGGKPYSRAQLAEAKGMAPLLPYLIRGGGGEFKTQQEAQTAADKYQVDHPNSQVTTKYNPKTGMWANEFKSKVGGAGEKYAHGTVTIGDTSYPSRTDPRTGDVEYKNEQGEWVSYRGSKAKKTGEQSKEEARQAVENLNFPMAISDLNKLPQKDRDAVRLAESHGILSRNADNTRIVYASQQKEPGQVIIDRRDESQITPSEVRSAAMNLIANPRLGYAVFRGNKAMQKAVLKELDKIEQEGGLPPGGASAIIGTAIEGNRQAYIQQTKNEAGVKVFESQFTRNSNAALQMSDQYSRTKYPDFNTLKNLYNSKTGDPDVVAFRYQTYIMMLENLKISTSGQQITSAELSIQAQKKADELVNSTFNWDQYKATVKDMQMDTSHRMLSYGATKAATKNSLTEALGGQPLPKVDDPTMVKGTLQIGNMKIETTVTKETSEMWSAEKGSAWTPAKKESKASAPLPYELHQIKAPKGTVRFKKGNKFLDIPKDQVEEFKKDHPEAKETE